MSERISGWQLGLVVFVTSMCLTPFGYADLHAHLGRAVWLGCALQAALCATAAAGILRLKSLSGGCPIGGVADAVFGRWAGAVYTLLLALYLVSWPPIGTITVATSLVQSGLVPLAPAWLVALPMLAVAAYGAWFGAEAIARLTELASWVIVPVIAIVATVPWTLAQSALRWPPWPAHALTITPEVLGYGMALRGIALVLVLPPVGGAPSRPSRPVVIALAAAWLATSLLFVLPHALFPPSGLSVLVNPMLSAMDAVPTRAVATHSLLAVVTPVWFAIGALITAAASWGAASLTLQAFHAAPSRWPLLIVVGAQLVSALPSVGYHLPDLDPYWACLGVIVLIVGPWSMALALGQAGARVAAPAT
jgi:hypothetical protein